MASLNRIHTDQAPSAIGPYSQAVLANGMLFISGQIAINPQTGEVETEIKAATHQVMKNLQAILEKAGTDFSMVVKSSIFLADMADFEAVNEVYALYFEKGEYPARETMAVKTLPKSVNVEISMIALVN